MNAIKNSTPCNPNASEEVEAVLRYLSDISGKGIITGQHTQTTVQNLLGIGFHLLAAGIRDFMQKIQPLMLQKQLLRAQRNTRH